ncbi:hypothetical protein [Bacillus phage Hakuna]|uniref:Uncharacterized protein n=2 Tax=Wphvirus hakuna TaxID=1987729 RepID=A0A222Z1J7_9CAUD|nr:hypothetical protein FP72_gp148 [Bacillus phage Hakuna]AHZ10166.1 hypothetical protein [Bacillus phage Hakuna]ASR78411.1 hypothetical protein PPISBEST_154 [Bacillus phage PPIsBest]
MSETVRNNEFYKAAADHLMISEHEDKSTGKPYSLYTLFDGEFAILHFNKNDTLVSIDVKTIIDTDLITDEEWIPLKSNQYVGNIIETFSNVGCNATFNEILLLDKTFDCRHNAYTSTFGNSESVSLRKFISRLEELREDDIKNILKAKCFRTTITLNDIMFWEER